MPAQVSICCAGGDGGSAEPDAGGGATGGSTANVSSWVIGVPGGWLQAPSSASTCTGWSAAANLSPDVQQSDFGTVRVDPDGVVAILYFRDCGEPIVRQFVWIRQETPESLANAALADMRSRLLRQPQARLSPPTRGVVNLETWLAAVNSGPVSVTASIPGLSSTATAVISSTTFEMGNGDTVVCPGVGFAWTQAQGQRPAPCGYTYRRADQPGSTTRVGLRVTWSVTFSASNGRTGRLPSVTSARQLIEYPVTEIQTIGTDG
jgi:hypothetical protein